jgi:hypothetical protein
VAKFNPPESLNFTTAEGPALYTARLDHPNKYRCEGARTRGWHDASRAEAALV